MKIVFIVFDATDVPDFKSTISAHAKLPMYTIKLLQEAGHTIELITNDFNKDEYLPFFTPGDGLTIHRTIDGRRLENAPDVQSDTMIGVSLVKFIKQILRIKQIVNKNNYDVVHFFGGGAMALFAGIFKIIGGKAPTIVTFNTGNIPTRFWFISKYFWKYISVVITSTEYMRNNCLQAGVPARIIRHGITRNIIDELGKENVGGKHRVLFWRDPTVENGADVCVKVYERLAPKYPGVCFDFALRPHCAPVPGIKELSEEYKNVNVYDFPYKNGVSLASLMAESICVLLPFRKLSCHPQFAVIESMLSRTPVITTAIDSNVELIINGASGYLTPVGDVDATAKAVEDILNDRQNVSRIGNEAYEQINSNWNWDI